MSASWRATQQQQQQQTEVARLTTHHLQLFLCMIQAWPGDASGLFSPSLCQAVLAAAGLVVAVMRSREVLVPLDSGIVFCATPS